MADVILSGIYAITNTVNGKRYVGSAVLLSRRIAKHKTELNCKTHCNAKLQRAWEKYGPDAFVFEVLEFVEDVYLLVPREQHWIDSIDACSSGYNIAPKAGSCLGVKKTIESIEKTAAAHRGMKRSEETRKKIREARSKQPPLSEEGRAKLVAALRARPPISDVTREKLSLANKGRKASPEQIEKNRQKQLGVKPSPEAIAKGIAARAGFKHTEASKAKMSEWQIGRKMSPESVAKSVANRVISEFGREKLAAAGRAHNGRPKSQQMKNKLSQTLKGRQPSAKCQEASRVAHTGKKFSPEVIAKRIATRARNRLMKEQQAA